MTIYAEPKDDNNANDEGKRKGLLQIVVTEEDSALYKSRRRILVTKILQAPTKTRGKRVITLMYSWIIRPRWCVNVRMVFRSTVTNALKPLCIDRLQARLVPTMRGGMNKLLCYIDQGGVIRDTSLQIWYSTLETFALLLFCIQQ